MLRKDGKDYIYLIWKQPTTRRQYIVGQLTKNGGYEFEYGFEVNEALGNGFELITPFEDVEKKYTNGKLFSIFSSRLPNPRRKGIERILAKYGLSEFDEYMLLKRSGGKLPIDTLELIDPIFENEESEFKRIFYLAGPRHYMGCNGEDCRNTPDLKLGEEVYLVLEPENPYDEDAIKIVSDKEDFLGYLPRYYSKEVTRFILDNVKCKCKIYEINKYNNCNECIRLELQINK